MTTGDANDNVLSVTDPSGNVSRSAYDPENRVISHTNGRGDVTTSTYDQTETEGPNVGEAQYGLLSYSADGNGHVSYFAYSPRNEILVTTAPDGTTETSTYDGGGRKISHTDANGHTIRYRYTTTDRLAEVDYPSGAPTKFTYSCAVQRVSMTDGTGTTTWGYDADNRVTSLAQPNGTVNYAYDTAGRCTQRALSNTYFWNYAYDNSGLLLSVTPPYGGSTGYVYDAGDHLTKQTDANGAVVSYSYNDLDEVTAEATVSNTGTQLAGDTYAYWPNGTVKTRTDFDGSTTSYVYDGADQLTSEIRTGSSSTYSASYTYDHNANRLTKTSSVNGGTATTDTYVYDVGDKLTSTSTKSFTYDADGNRLTMTTGGQTTTYSWDYEDRLTGISGTSSANVYNGCDLRVGRTSTTGTPYYYTCDGADPASPVLRDGPDVYTQGLCQTLTSTGATSWYVLDRLGSNTRTMNAAESVTDAQVFDGFGCLVNRTGTTTLPFGFDGKSGYETDSDTGLMLLGHRFYDPSIGRFLSRDPIHDGDNDYAYCDNEPVNAVDPSGEAESRGNPFRSLMNSFMGQSDDDGKKDQPSEAPQKTLPDTNDDSPAADSQYTTTATAQTLGSQGAKDTAVGAAKSVGNALGTFAPTGEAQDVKVANGVVKAAEEGASGAASALGRAHKPLLLVDENLPKSLAQMLESKGHNAISTQRAGLNGVKDPQIIPWLQSQGAKVITKNFRDFPSHLVIPVTGGNAVRSAEQIYNQIVRHL